MGGLALPGRVVAISSQLPQLRQYDGPCYVDVMLRVVQL